MTKAEQLLAEVRKEWAPPIKQTVSEWADEHLYLSPEYAAESGKWTTIPLQREPMDCVSDPAVWQVVIRSCTQLLKTSVIQAAIGWAIDVDPGPILVVLPRDQDAKKFSQERIAPMIRDTPRLTDKVAADKSRNSGNTIEEKWFRGGILAMTSASVPANLGRRAIRFLFADEEDKWEVSAGLEGKPFKLAEKRQATFRHRKKSIRCCSPTRPGSAIDLAYQDSDQREYFVPCPHCGAHQSMMGRFRTHVRWDSSLPTREAQAASARYHCSGCDAAWMDADRHAAVERGEWRAQAPFNGIAGFWISELYSPWKQLSEIVLDFLRAKDDPEAMIVFVNTSLAENWTDPGEAPDYDRLMERREPYSVGTIPRGGLFLTAGADVHPDRIEVEVVAWGRGRESWSVDYRILEGKPSSPEVWEQFDSLLAESFPATAGAGMPISKLFIDSGHASNEVYAWVRRQPPQRVTAIKGAATGLLPVSQPSPVEVAVGGKKIRRGLRVKTVLVGFFKAEFYADLQRRRPTPEELAEGFGYPPGYCHFPDGKHYGDEHFKQICAEQLVTHVNRKTGRSVQEWQQLRARNEALDCRVYARAAAWDCGLDRYQERHWQLLEAQSGNAYSDRRPAPPPPKPEVVEVKAQLQQPAVTPPPVLRSLPPPQYRRRTFARFL